MVLPRFPSLLAEAVFDRQLRKVMRYRLQASRHNWKRLPPFGSVLKGSRRTVGEFYLRADSVRRLWEWSVDWAKHLEIEREKNRVRRTRRHLQARRFRADTFIVLPP